MAGITWGIGPDGIAALIEPRGYNLNSVDATALSVYQSARAELVKQYGQPTETEERFQAPYRKGDGKEIEAFRAG